MDPQALDLATKTLASAIDALMAKGSLVAPLVFVMKDGQRESRPVVVPKDGDAVAVAKRLAVSEAGADATAYAIDGSILFDGKRNSGIVVEAWNFRTSRGARVGLRYELKGTLRKKPQLIGSPLHLSRAGWYDPEDGEPAPPARDVPDLAPSTLAPLPATPPSPVINDAPVVIDLDEGFGPPPAVADLAPVEVAPAPPPSSYGPPPVIAAEPAALPRVFSAPPTYAPHSTPAPPTPLPGAWPAPVAFPEFGPPPTSAPVPGLAPPDSARTAEVMPEVQATQAPTVPPAAEAPPSAEAPAPSILDTAPPAAAHPVDVQSGPPEPAAVVPGYLPLPIQRTETPLGNRAMFAGIMELATKSRSFPPFAIVQKDGDWEQITMTDASLAEAATSVRAYARTRTDADFIAFAIDSFVSVDDVQVAAVVVEVWEYATRVSFSVAQRYIWTGEPLSPRLSGRPLMRTQNGWVDVPSSMTLGGQVQFGYRDPDPA